VICNCVNSKQPRQQANGREKKKNHLSPCCMAMQVQESHVKVIDSEMDYQNVTSYVPLSLFLYSYVLQPLVAHGAATVSSIMESSQNCFAS